MKIFKSVLFFSCLLAAGACATNYEEEKTVLLSKTENEPADLVTSFDVGKEHAESFKVQPVAETAATPVKTVEAKAPKKKAKIKEDKKAAAGTVAPSGSILPADYPEEFKVYDAKSQLVWDKFKPVFYQGEQSIMAVTYLGVTAGYITILSKEVVSLNNKIAFHYFARFKSSDSYRYFYWLDDKLDSFVEKDTFLPMKYTLIQREKKQDVDDLQLFDFQKMMTYNWYKRVKEGSNKDEKGEQKIPRLAQDSFSALQFVRGLPLVKGDVYEFPVITRGKFWLLKVEVVGEDIINVADKEVKAIKIKAETNFPGVLKKSGDIIFWYGADTERRLLKFQAKIKLGSIFGELVEYRPGVKVL